MLSEFLVNYRAIRYVVHMGFPMSVRTTPATVEVAVSRLLLVARLFEAAAFSPHAWSASFDGHAPAPLDVDITVEDGDILVEMVLHPPVPARCAEIRCDDDALFYSPGPFSPGRPVLVSMACRVPVSIG